MKGDFSFLPLGTAPHYTGVLHQQGRVLLDRDWNEAAAIAAGWRTAAGRDTFGGGILAVPVASPGAFKVLGASSDGVQVKLSLDAGRAWADGMSLTLDATASFNASYFDAPYQSVPAAPASIAAGVRDLVVLEVWEETVSGFQDPLNLIEPALGGPDTTERTQAFVNLKLLRLGPNDDCSAAVRLLDDVATKGKLTVSPAPMLSIGGDCPLEAGGGYSGMEHYLYRIEVAEPDAGGQARFKWSQWNGGLVGRGLYAAGAAGAAGTGTLTITANDQMINHCGVSEFYLEVLAFDAAFGSWRIAMTAAATLAQDGILALASVQGVWPGAPTASGFFRLWNGIGLVAQFPLGGSDPVELKDGVRLEFDAASSGNANYQPGDYWTFPVRASGVAFAAPIWPAKAAPHGVRHSRVALGILNWSGAAPVSISAAAGEIDDCRRMFRPLSNQKICCTFIVGDGRTSRGDFDSIETALQHMPASGGEICLLPGLHEANAVIAGRSNITIKGCDTRTKIIARKGSAGQPIFTIRDAANICLEHMELIALSGPAIVIDGGKDGQAADIEVAHNRILGCTHAVRAEQVKRVQIHHNRIRMLDKRGGDVAIYVAGDDCLIERNDIRLVPSLSMPPLKVPDEPIPVDPNDPCAKLELVYGNRRVFIHYVNAVWNVYLPALFLLVQPYRAPGGIQLGGGSERVQLLDNTIVGGAGNGITLGATSRPPSEPEPEHRFTLPEEARVDGRVLGPDGKPRAGVQITLTSETTGQVRTFLSDADGTFFFGSNAATFLVTEGEPGYMIDKLDLRADKNRNFFLTIVLKEDEKPVDHAMGFLYDIQIERNSISAMGLSGIGTSINVAATPERKLTASALAQARAQLGAPVIGLAIHANRIRGCLLNPFDNAMRAITLTQGLGGISLGMCQDAAIRDNQIDDNGVAGASPVCGIFVAYGEDVEISGNRVLNNGPLATGLTSPGLVAGRRGGIVLNLVSSFNVLSAGATGKSLAFRARPAARVHANLVDQPAGHALYALAVGPVQCNDNALASELSGLSAVERLAGTVFIYDLGGVNRAGAGITLGGNKPGQEVELKDGAAPDGSSHAAPASMLAQRTAAAAALIPAGNLMFNDNQLRTGPGNTSNTCHVLSTMDDLACQDNQSDCLRSTNMFANGLLAGDTLRASGNRLSEPAGSALLSLFTLGVRLNNTSFNQGEHCIVGVDQNPAMAEVVFGNQVRNPSKICGNLGMVAARLFKPHG